MHSNLNWPVAVVRYIAREELCDVYSNHILLKDNRMSQCARGCKIKVVSKHSKTAAYIVSVILMNKLKLGVVL